MAIEINAMKLERTFDRNVRNFKEHSNSYFEGQLKGTVHGDERPSEKGN